jgi:formylglycine-generating enzyme required for sulfatase activity
MRYIKLCSILIISIITISVCAQDKLSPSDQMKLIPGGEFTMGKDSRAGYDFSPAHKVYVDSFFLDQFEVSNRAYLKFCEATGNALPEFWNTDNFRNGEDYLDYPVIGVNWVNANKYASWAGKRLPTEAEWEYAARGGLQNKEFPNGNSWTKARAHQDTATIWINLLEAVGQYPPNGYGLHDMGGNVWEWVFDIFSETYYIDSDHMNPKGPERGSNRVIRSGSWHSGAMCKKVYYRKGIPGSWSDFAVGFRCAKDVR